MNSSLLTVILFVLLLTVVLCLLFKKKDKSVFENTDKEIDYSMSGEEEKMIDNSNGKY